MAAGSGSRAVCRIAWKTIMVNGPMTARDLAEVINNRKTRYGSTLKQRWTQSQIVQFLIRSPLFYPDPECVAERRSDGKMVRENPLWFAYPLEEVVKSLAGKTHVRTPTKYHPSFLRKAIEEYEKEDTT